MFGSLVCRDKNRYSQKIPPSTMGPPPPPPKKKYTPKNMQEGCDEGAITHTDVH